MVDEYGEIEGLISVEDIFKEITGKFGGDKEELEKEFYQQKMVNSKMVIQKLEI